MGYVYVLGVGASREVNGPLMKDFFDFNDPINKKREGRPTF